MYKLLVKNRATKRGCKTLYRRMLAQCIYFDTDFATCQVDFLDFFPAGCLGWDLGLNWVSFWGISYLLLNIDTADIVLTQDKTHYLRRDNQRDIKTTNATGINKQSWGVNNCLGTTCQGSVWSVASCFQIGNYTLFLPADFSSVCCCQSR